MRKGLGTFDVDDDVPINSTIPIKSQTFPFILWRGSSGAGSATPGDSGCAHPPALARVPVAVGFGRIAYVELLT